MVDAEGRNSIKLDWTRTFLLVFVSFTAGALLVALGLSVTDAGAAQVSSAGENGVFAIAGQISRETYGLYLVDYNNKTICVYRFYPSDRKLQLMAARTYEFDVKLDSYNTSQPLPAEVRELVGQQKRLKDLGIEKKGEPKKPENK
jgi:hypothetical protein